MKTVRILNLYACLGGNRYKWDEVAKEHNIKIIVTAIELDKDLAKLYKARFPNDTVIVADAHKYLLEHYKEFDFVWSSPPCPTHSRARFARKEDIKPMYPNFGLYEEIVFLQKWFKGGYIVENVIPYYTPLIPAKKRGRHLYWTNFHLPKILSERHITIMSGKDEVTEWCKFHEYDFTQYKGAQRTDKVARNLVDYQAGRTILESFLKVHKQKETKQQPLL